MSKNMRKKKINFVCVWSYRLFSYLIECQWVNIDLLQKKKQTKKHLYIYVENYYSCKIQLNLSLYLQYPKNF